MKERKRERDQLDEEGKKGEMYSEGRTQNVKNNY